MKLTAKEKDTLFIDVCVRTVGPILEAEMKGGTIRPHEVLVDNAAKAVIRAARPIVDNIIAAIEAKQ